MLKCDARGASDSAGSIANAALLCVRVRACVCERVRVCVWVVVVLLWQPVPKGAAVVCGALMIVGWAFGWDDGTQQEREGAQAGSAHIFAKQTKMVIAKESKKQGNVVRGGDDGMREAQNVVFQCVQQQQQRQVREWKAERKRHHQCVVEML